MLFRSHTGFCRGQRRCTELRLLQRCTRGWPWYVTKWRPIPGRGLPRLASPPSGTEAGGIPCPAIARPLLLRKILVVGGRQALPSACPAPCLQLSVSHRYRCCTTRSSSPPGADCHQECTSGSEQDFHLQLHQGTARGEARGCKHQAAPQRCLIPSCPLGILIKLS